MNIETNVSKLDSNLVSVKGHFQLSNGLTNLNLMTTFTQKHIKYLNFKENKSSQTNMNLNGNERSFPFEIHDLTEVFKYLGYTLKPNNYVKVDWLWLLARIKKRVNFGCNMLKVL